MITYNIHGILNKFSSPVSYDIMFSWNTGAFNFCKSWTLHFWYKSDFKWYWVKYFLWKRWFLMILERLLSEDSNFTWLSTINPVSWTNIHSGIIWYDLFQEMKASLFIQKKKPLCFWKGWCHMILKKDSRQKSDRLRLLTDISNLLIDLNQQVIIS